MWIFKIKIAILALGVIVTSLAGQPSADNANCTAAQSAANACIAQK